jgi:hypothetical protein
MLLDRRSFTLGGVSLFILPTVTRAAGVDQATPPLQFGNADFAGAWTPDFPIAELVAAAPPIKKGIAELLGANIFKSLDQLHKFFSPHTGGASFLAWFNSNIAEKGQWKGRSASGPNLEANFDSYWSHATSTRSCSAMEFITYMAVFINECGGNLVSQPEKFGRPPDHPDISYLFDAFGMTYPNGKSWHKKSYNVAPNLTVLQSLSDPVFQGRTPIKGTRRRRLFVGRATRCGARPRTRKIASTQRPTQTNSARCSKQIFSNFVGAGSSRRHGATTTGRSRLSVLVPDGPLGM